MDCKLVAIALFILALDCAHAADVWNVIGGGDANFFLVKRTYPRGGNQCAYMKRTSKNDDSHTLEAEMSYRRPGDTSFQAPSTYTVTATQEGGTEYNIMTVTAKSGSQGGIQYKLVHSDGNNCNILQAKTGPFAGKCELWAPEGQASGVGNSCDSHFATYSCGEVQETPYTTDCRVPS
uniref:TSGP4 n=1 Tax=Ornithodoros moubata TaxID=6938 RepID=M9W8K9_ORNMO|nr:TSGP4 [Ornithodoros moubata]